MEKHFNDTKPQLFEHKIENVLTWFAQSNFYVFGGHFICCLKVKGSKRVAANNIALPQRGRTRKSSTMFCYQSSVSA